MAAAVAAAVTADVDVHLLRLSSFSIIVWEKKRDVERKTAIKIEGENERVLFHSIVCIFS